MFSFSLNTKIKSAEYLGDFLDEYRIGEGDILCIDGFAYTDKIKDKTTGSKVIIVNNYGRGEPSDIMLESILNDIGNYQYKRVIGLGGGTVIDVAKLLSIDDIKPIEDVFSGAKIVSRNRGLIIIPTTCGTGSEVTNISIIELTKIGTKRAWWLLSYSRTRRF